MIGVTDHLEAALEALEADDVECGRFHVRQAVQHLEADDTTARE